LWSAGEGEQMLTESPTLPPTRRNAPSTLYLKIEVWDRWVGGKRDSWEGGGIEADVVSENMLVFFATIHQILKAFHFLKKNVCPHIVPGAPAGQMGVVGERRGAKSPGLEDAPGLLLQINSTLLRHPVHLM